MSRILTAGQSGVGVGVCLKRVLARTNGLSNGVSVDDGSLQWLGNLESANMYCIVVEVQELACFQLRIQSMNKTSGENWSSYKGREGGIRGHSWRRGKGGGGGRGRETPGGNVSTYSRSKASNGY